jgi:type III secretory pathway component EscT
VLVADVKELAVAWLLASARAVPVAWAIPAFGGVSLPTVLRVAVGLGLALLFLPGAGMLPPVGDAVVWVVLFSREILVGISLAFVCSCMFRVAEAAGQLIDVFRGAPLPIFSSPTSHEQQSPMALLMLLLAAVAFFQIGGPHHIGWGLQRSYDAIPLAWNHPVLDTQAAATAAIRASATLIESAISLSAPFLVAALLSDLVLGLVGRTIPQLSVASAGAPLKSVVVVGALLLGLGGMQSGLQGILQTFLGIFRTGWIR